MATLREGQQVVFTFDDKNQIGVIENIKLINKVKRYQVRAESGRLYPYLGINTEKPGKINLPLTKAYFAAKEEELMEMGNESEMNPDSSDK